jgi:septal ring factor EnvC (AmiA/AmiB activator)
MDTNDSWHLSKSVPLGLIIGLITQGAAIVWTVSMMMSDIESNRKDIAENQLRVSRLETSVQNQAVSMARIDENIKAIRTAVEKMSERSK